jgi:RNA polymerase sigma factor (sigma-70 family)
MAFRQDYNLLSDEELVKVFQSEDSHGAFTALVLRYQKRIYFAARRMVEGDHIEADEIAQDTFVKVYESLPSFRGDSKVYTWIYRIMVNTVIGRSRKAKGRKSIDIEDVANSLESSEPSADQMLETTETKKLIEQAIETLPPKQKEVFLMRFYDELPYEEIGQVLGTSVGGLKANYFHAVKKIGEYLNQSSKIAPEQVENVFTH